MAQEQKIIDELYEQFKVGVTLFEIARFNTDKKVALPMAREGLSLATTAAKAFMDNPDLCPPYKKFPPKGPWPRPNWWDLVIDNPLSDQKIGIKNAEVLGIVENLRSSISSVRLKENLKELSKTTLSTISL